MPITINGTTGISGVDGSAGTPAFQGSDTNTGISFPVADTVAVNTGGAEALRVDASKRLLVGTSSYSGTATAVLLGNSASATSQAALILQRGEATPADGAALGGVFMQDNTINNSAAMIAYRDGGTWSGTSKPTRLVFSTTADGASSPTERMRIGNAGRIDCISSDGAYTVNALTNAAAGTTVRTFVGVHSHTGYNTGTISFNVYSNGNVTNTNNSYAGISDVKLKENIVNAGSQWGDLRALQVRKFNFKEETGQPTHTQIGLIAQEAERVSPGLVFETPDRDLEGNDLGTVTKSVNYSVLYMKAVKALQEAMERIEQLETEMAAVKAQLA